MKKMFKANKGITMVSLIVTIFMLAFVVGTVIYFSRSIVETARFENIKSNMILIQAQAKIIYEKHNFDSTVPLIGNGPLENGFYELTANDLINMGLDEVTKDFNSDKECYYIKYPSNSSEEVEVRYEPGITYDNSIYKDLTLILSSKL